MKPTATFEDTDLLRSKTSELLSRTDKFHEIRTRILGVDEWLNLNGYTSQSQYQLVIKLQKEFDEEMEIQKRKDKLRCPQSIGLKKKN